MNCAACWFDNPEGMRFCGGCGAPLTETGSPTPLPENEAERRQLTIMFCDLVGSTALSERLDPEDLREVIRGYQAVAGKAVGRFGGHIAQYLGDGILAYFGYPVAHEDDARRAILAGLAVVAGVCAEGDRFDLGQEIRLQVRIGIHTGPVVAGDIGVEGARERLALGQTPNVAARVQGLAEPNTVLATAATYRLVKGFFAARSLGLQELKGLSQSIEIFQLLRESGVRNAFELAVVRGLTPAVGRSEEMRLLAERLEQVHAGHGQALLLMAEAGLGKSRLIKMFSDSVVAEARWLICRCSPFLANSAFSPLIELLENAFRLHREDSATLRLHKLEEAVRRFGLPLAEVVPLLARLLSIPLGEGYLSTGLSPQRQKEKTLTTLLELLLRMAERRTVVFVMEDLHWVDPSTLEFLDLLVRRGPEAHILTLLTARPSFSPPWTGPLAPTRVDLDRLDDDEVAEMVSGITVKALPPELLRQVVERTDGVPLFVEELTKMLLESGLLCEATDHYELAGPLPSRAIPTTLQDSLTARLDHLATARELAQVGATLGREFSYPLLAAVAHLAGPLLESELGRLVEAGLLYQSGTPPHSSYAFKHALIQEAAYSSLLKSQRRQYHQRIAQALTESFPEVATTRPELLAHHYTEADLKEPAVDHWHLAGRHAMERFANVEAIGHLQKGLELLAALPPGPERDRRELDLQMTLGPALTAIKGYAASEVERTYARAKDLCEKGGDAVKRFWALWGLGVFNLVCARLEEGTGPEMLSVAEALGSAELLLGAHFAIGVTEAFCGELTSARDHLERAVAIDSPDRRNRYSPLAEDDPGIAALCFASLVLWLQGHPDRALQRSREAIALARNIGQPFGLAFALTHTAFLHQFRREIGAVKSFGAEAVTLAQEKGFLVFVIMGSFVLGWADEQGDGAAPEAGAEGLARMVECFGAWRAAGARIWQPYFLCLLVEACLRRGRTTEARDLLEQAETALAETAEHFWESEVYRLRAELTLAVGGTDGASSGSRESAERSLERALGAARRRGARSLELRAAVSLCRLWQAQGKAGPAQELLRESLAGFDEEGNTPDLSAARTLLAELPTAPVAPAGMVWTPLA